MELNAKKRKIFAEMARKLDESARQVGGVRTRKAQNFTRWRKFKYTLTNRSVKYASNFNDQGFLC
jgi:hypothetical protein